MHPRPAADQSSGKAERRQQTMQRGAFHESRQSIDAAVLPDDTLEEFDKVGVDSIFARQREILLRQNRMILQSHLPPVRRRFVRKRECPVPHAHRLQ